MDLDNAISVHVQWKSKLTAFIARPDNSLNADSVAKDNQCELGTMALWRGPGAFQITGIRKSSVGSPAFS